MRAIYWFRNDLRLNDNLSLNLALKKSDEILFVYIHDIANEKNSPWGFKKMGEHRKLFLSQGLKELNQNLEKYSHSLNVYIDDSVSISVEDKADEVDNFFVNQLKPLMRKSK